MAVTYTATLVITCTTQADYDNQLADAQVAATVTKIVQDLPRKKLTLSIVA